MAVGEWSVPGGTTVGLVADKVEKKTEDASKTEKPKTTKSAKK